MTSAKLESATQALIEAALRAAFRRDMTETALAGFTPLGHYELQRKRDRAPLLGVQK